MEKDICPLVSICIPVYEMYGYGKKYLRELILTIEKQTYDNIEIIISDHSKDDIISLFCGLYKCKYNLIYFKNERGRGNSSINMNECIKRATGDYIKMMHMDDIFCDDNCISTMINQLKELRSELEH